MSEKTDAEITQNWKCQLMATIATLSILLEAIDLENVDKLFREHIAITKELVEAIYQKSF